MHPLYVAEAHWIKQSRFCKIQHALTAGELDQANGNHWGDVGILVVESRMLKNFLIKGKCETIGSCHETARAIASSLRFFVWDHLRIERRHGEHIFDTNVSKSPTLRFVSEQRRWESINIF